MSVLLRIFFRPDVNAFDYRISVNFSLSGVMVRLPSYALSFSGLRYVVAGAAETFGSGMALSLNKNKVPMNIVSLKVVFTGVGLVCQAKVNSINVLAVAKNLIDGAKTYTPVFL
jgi:hypothetical protein